jgi:hypothetical protein
MSDALDKEWPLVDGKLSDDDEFWGYADALLAPSGPFAPLLARIGELEAALEETKGALKQGLGIIVEFGDMNGFRNTTDEELGRLVKTVAEDIGHLLNKLEGRPYRARSALDQETRHAG